MSKVTNALPSIITLINLLSGFMAIVIGDLKIGILLIVIGALADVFDGLVARILKVDSDMGRELDSLADIITFGAAPAYLYYQLAPEQNIFYAMAICTFVAGGALRLAKFNTLPPSKYFRGLPIPAAATFIVGVLNAYLKESSVAMSIITHPYLYVIIPIALGLLMNTNITMFSFKSLQKDIASNFFPVLLIVLLLLFFLIDHKIAIPLTIIAYIVLSMISATLARRRSL